MSLRFYLFLITLFSFNLIWRANVCEARYLPTRSQEDRLSKLKELLQEVLKSGDSKNDAQMRNQYESFGNAYLGPEEYNALTNDGYPPLSYNNRDIDSQIARRILGQRQITKT